MKRSTRMMSALLAMMMILSASVMAMAADETTVFIPTIIAKLGLPERPGYVTLTTHTESVPNGVKTDANGKIKYDYNGNPILNYGTVENADIELQFSQKPDWAGVIWAEGYETLEVDDSGYAMTSMAGHMRQPGTWVWNDPETMCDSLTGEIVWRKDGYHYMNGRQVFHSAGDPAPEWCHVTGGDYAYMAGKGNVTAQYGRSGKVNYVEYRVEEDFFRTGMQGGYSIIRYEPVTIKNDVEVESLVYPEVPEVLVVDPMDVVEDNFGNLCYVDDNGVLVPFDESPYQVVFQDNSGNLYYIDENGNRAPYEPDLEPEVVVTVETYKTTVWYVSSVTAYYPEGNYIVQVEADYRNDAKKTLTGYKITYATAPNETYKITYAPATTTVLEDHASGSFYTWPAKNAPSTDLEEYFRQQTTDPTDLSYLAFSGMYLHHYTEDEVLGGIFTSGSTVLSSGSGKNLKKWYKFNGTGVLNGVKVNNNGRQVKKSNLKPCTYFVSPRVQ